MSLIDSDKAINVLNKAIEEHDKSLIKAGLYKDGENNQIPEFMWNYVVRESSVLGREQLEEDLKQKHEFAKGALERINELIEERDKIREEIEQSRLYKGYSGNSSIDQHNIGCDFYFDKGLEKALQIIDKYTNGE